MSANEKILKEIADFRKTFPGITNEVFFPMLSNQQQLALALAESSAGTKRVVVNTAAVVPHPNAAGEAKRLEAERLEAERLEAERLEAERKAKQEKFERDLKGYQIQARAQLVDAVYKARKAASDAGNPPEVIQAAGEKARDTFIRDLFTLAKSGTDRWAVYKLAFLREIFENTGAIEGICPLTNVGNSCYMNATMQMLYNIPEFLTMFSALHKDWETKDVVGCGVPERAARELFRNTNLFFTGMYRYSLLGIPLDIAALMGASKDKNVYDDMIRILQLGKFRQEDVTEFIDRLLNNLFCVCSVAPMKNLFLTKHIFDTFCVNPAILVAPRIDNELILKLFIEPPSITDIQSGIHAYQSLERLTAGENDLLVCGEGGRTGKARGRQITIQIPPTTKYFMVSLQRNTDYTNKNKKPIHLNPVIHVGGVDFRIRAAVCHLGNSAELGHYVTYLFNEEGRVSSRLDDAQVYPVRGGEMQYDSAVEGSLDIKVTKGSLAACGDCETAVVTFGPKAVVESNIIGIDEAAGRIYISYPPDAPSAGPFPISLINEDKTVRAEGTASNFRKYFETHDEKLLIGALLILYERIGPTGPAPPIPVVDFNLEEARARIAGKSECLADIAASYGISVEDLRARVATAGGRRKTLKKRRNH